MPWKLGPALWEPGLIQLRVPENEDAELPGGSGGGEPWGRPEIGRRRLHFGIFPWIWVSSRKGGVGLVLREVQQQMAAGPRVPSSGEGTGDGSCHGLDGLFASWRAFLQKKKGKLRAKGNAQACPSLTLGRQPQFPHRESGRGAISLMRAEHFWCCIGCEAFHGCR